MVSSIRSLVVLTSVLVLTGCLERLVINKEAEVLRHGVPATNTLHDYETAQTTSRAELGRLEGLHRLTPTHEDVLFLLTRGWTLSALRYGIDDYERAIMARSTVMAKYYRDRMLAGFQRAQHYGLKLLGQLHGGMKEAREAPSELIGWTKNRPDDPEDAEPLLWTGLAFVGGSMATTATAGSPEGRAAADDRRVGLAMLERSVALDETAAFGLGLVALGVVEPRSPDGEDGAPHLHRAVALSKGKYLPARLALALDDCRRGLDENARIRLQAIAEAGDRLPAARLDNIIAMQRAKRYLASPELHGCEPRPRREGRGDDDQRPTETSTSTKRPPGN